MGFIEHTYKIHHICILFPKIFWPTVRKNCSSEQEKLLKSETVEKKSKNVPSNTILTHYEGIHLLKNGSLRPTWHFCYLLKTLFYMVRVNVWERHFLYAFVVSNSYSNSEIYDWLQTAPFGFRMAWYGTHRFPRLLGFLKFPYFWCTLYIHTINVIYHVWFQIWKQKIIPAWWLISFIVLALWAFQHGKQFLGTGCFDTDTYGTWTLQYMDFLTEWMLIVFPRDGTNQDGTSRCPLFPQQKYFLVALTRDKEKGNNPGTKLHTT